MLDPCASARWPACCSTSTTVRRGRSGPRRRRDAPRHPGAPRTRRPPPSSPSATSRSHDHSPAADEVALVGADVLVIAHPSEAKWERTVGGGLAACSRPAEIAPSQASCRAAAGSSCSARPKRTSTAATSTSCSRPSACASRTPRLRLQRPGRRRPGSSASRAPGSATLASSTACGRWAVPRRDARSGRCRRRRAADRAVGGPAAAPAWSRRRRTSEGRVVVVADSDLFGDDHLRGPRPPAAVAQPGLLGGAGRVPLADSEPIVSEAAKDPAWLRLQDETNALRSLQEPKGEVDLDEHDVGEVRAHVAAMVEAIGELAPRFPHEQDYLAQVSRRPAAPGSTADAASRTSGRRSRCSGPSSTAWTASSTSSSSPCTRPTARPTRGSRR